MSTDAMRFSLFPSHTSPKHEYHHACLLNWMKERIQLHRPILGVEASWQIELKICCRKDLPGSEGAVAWHHDANQAYMHIRCDMWPALTEWVLLHELVELRRAPEADVFMKALSYIEKNKPLRDHLHSTYLTARNQSIEAELAHYLGYRRPGHLVDIPGEEGSISELSPSEMDTLILLPTYRAS